MKFQTQNSAFLPAATLASRFIHKQSTLTTLSNILISAEGDAITLRATNLECGVELSLPAKVNKSGVAAVPGGILVGFLQNTRDMLVSGEFDGSVFALKTERSNASIKTTPTDDFPLLPRVPAGDSFTIRTGDFVTLLRAVVSCAATSTIKPELQSVCISGVSGKLTAAATDSFRLAEKIVAIKSRGSVPNLLIPARNATELIRILETHTGDIEVYYTKNQLAAQINTVYYTSRLIDGTFPNYQQIIPKENTAEAVLLRDDFTQALRSLQIFTDKFLQIQFHCDPKQKVVELSSRNADVGEETITIKAAVSGEDIRMSFNSRYLADAAVPIAGESLRLRMQGPGKPLVIRDAADDSYLYLAMPMNR